MSCSSQVRHQPTTRSRTKSHLADGFSPVFVCLCALRTNVRLPLTTRSIHMSPCIGFVMGRLDKQGRFAPMVANQLINGSGSQSRMASAGVRSPSTIRPRVLSLRTISRKSNKLCLDRSVPFGSVGTVARWCSPWCRAARVSAGHRSRSGTRSTLEIFVESQFPPLVPGQGPLQGSGASALHATAQNTRETGANR